MSITPKDSWLNRFAVATAAATLILIGVGGLVTSKGAGMAVPDWPTSYGYNMFALPFRYWTGGVLYEHTHRLWASIVGVMVVALTRWMAGHKARLPLAVIGAAEVVAGFGLILVWPELRGAGFFLKGIGVVVLLAALVWVRNAPAPGRLPMLGWSAFFLVQFQGLLGGLRVVLFKNEMGIFHGALAQLFFVLLCSIVLLTNRRWIASRVTRDVPGKLRVAAWITTLLIFGQLVIGATMRHQHAGLAIPDFPLAYGEVWPATDPESVTRYNQQRVELISLNPITAFQIHLQMAHRIVAAVIFIGVAFCAWVAVRQLRWTSRVARCSVFWFGLITIQVVLGAATIWSNKAADIATLHVLVGALSLATGAMLCVYFDRASRAVRADACLSTEPQVPAGLPVSQATLNS